MSWEALDLSVGRLSPRAARHHAMAPRFVLDAQGLDRSYEHWLQHLVASPRYPEHAAN